MGVRSDSEEMAAFFERLPQVQSEPTPAAQAEDVAPPIEDLPPVEEEVDPATDTRYIRVVTPILDAMPSGTTTKIGDRMVPVMLWIDNHRKSITYRLRRPGEEGLDHVVEEPDTPAQFPQAATPSPGFGRDVRKPTASMLKDQGGSDGYGWLHDRIGTSGYKGNAVNSSGRSGGDERLTEPDSQNWD